MKVYLKVMSHIFSISQYITYNAFHTISWLSTQTALLTACYWLLCIHYCSAKEWNPDVRSNESRFLLLRTDSRVCVWKRPCAAMDRACQQDAIQTGGRSLIVRNIFFLFLRTLHKCDTQILLQTIYLFYACHVREGNTFFKHDNAIHVIVHVWPLTGFRKTQFTSGYPIEPCGSQI